MYTIFTLSCNNLCQDCWTLLKKARTSSCHILHPYNKKLYQRSEGKPRARSLSHKEQMNRNEIRLQEPDYMDQRSRKKQGGKHFNKGANIQKFLTIECITHQITYHLKLLIFLLNQVCSWPIFNVCIWTNLVTFLQKAIVEYSSILKWKGIWSTNGCRQQ